MSTVQGTSSSTGNQAYQDFIAKKSQVGSAHGFDPIWMPDFLYPFQRHLVDYAIRRGRALIGADCGLGKGPIQFVWCENMLRHTNKPGLITTTLGDSLQMIQEGHKFGIDLYRSKDGKFPSGARTVVTNYERLQHFDPSDFAYCSFNESSILKNFDGATKALVTEFSRTIPFRLLCSATPAPNDYVELGTSAEALGELGFQDMVSKFFKKETSKDHLGWGRTKYRLRGHAERDFWRWVCSWMRACRKPSDLGFDDGPFTLPPLRQHEHIVQAKVKRDGCLFDMPAENQQELLEERRRTIHERCEKAASLVNDTGKPATVWCNLNPEGDLLNRLISDAEQVSGANSDEEKEELFQGFATGQIRVLVTKPEIAAWGMNWQHCAHVVCFPTDSFERWYQLVRRHWRFGQQNPVDADIVASEGQTGVLANLQRKANKVEVMFQNLVELMNDTLQIKRVDRFTQRIQQPSWTQKEAFNGCH